MARLSWLGWLGQILKRYIRISIPVLTGVGVEQLNNLITLIETNSLGLKSVVFEMIQHHIECHESERTVNDGQKLTRKLLTKSFTNFLVVVLV